MRRAVAALAVAWGVSASADCAAPFAAPRAFPTIGSVSSFAVAEMDGDPHLDVVSFAGFGVSLLRGRGDATLDVAVALPDDLRGYRGTAGELNGDGLSDVIVLDGNELHAALRRSDGSFGPAHITAAPEYYDHVLVADVDGDGHGDVIAAEDLEEVIGVFRGNGDGTFAEPSTYAVGGNDIRLGDFDGDGRIDVVATGYDPALVLLLNQGGGQFVSHQVPIGRSSAGQIEEADFDGDGRLDLVVASFERNLLLLRGNGDGTFRQSSFPILASSAGYDSGDIDGDGDPDLLVRDDGDWATVLLNDGRGSFARTGSRTFVDGAFRLADLDRDGRLEIVSSGGDSQIVVTRGVSGGRFAGRTLERVPYLGDLYADLETVAAFLDGDPYGDVLVAGYSTRTLSTLFGTAEGVLAGRIDYDVGDHPISVAAGDLDGDGRSDAVAVLANDGIAVLLNRGDGVLTRPVAYAVTADPRSAVLADFNRDGRLDVLVVHEEDAHVTYLPGTGGGGLGAPRLVTSPAGYTPGRPLAADFTNDGRADLFLPDRYSSAFLRGRGDGTFDAPVSLQIDADAAVAGDFNGDGTLDIAALTIFGDLSLHQGGGTGAFLLRWSTDFDTFADGITAADFDGDGKLDVALAVDYPGGSVHILHGRGNGTLDRLGQQYATIGNALSVTTGDWNGDGKPDLFATSKSVYATVLMNECARTLGRRRAVRH